VSKILLNIRQKDREFFELIKNGQKTIETRAATKKFQKIKPGDILIFKCGKDRLEKEVAKVHFFKTIEDLVKSLDLKKIMPQVKSENEAKQVWYSFPGYQEKIKNHGLAAFELK
jgi:ASC-1-like (ASCH) protein